MEAGIAPTASSVSRVMIVLSSKSLGLGMLFVVRNCGVFFPPSTAQIPTWNG